jgi:uncharacterized protein YndB with AHSA1/START domain
MADGFVSVSRRIKVPAGELFALLADSANHPLIDGSGMVREPAPAARLSAAGDTFVMSMYHHERGHYQMRNEVVEYEPGRRLAWDPAPPWSPSSSTARGPRRACARPSVTARSGGSR